MKKTLQLTMLLLCLSLWAQAQKTVVSGKVIDTFNNETIQYATVTVLNAADSTLLGFGHSDKDGKFSFTAGTAPKFLLLITGYGFADYTDIVNSGSSGTLDLGNVILFTREKVLSEFVVMQRRGSIVIKGDTTEYNADSFKVDANANVEALLKKLPGLQVDKNGQITAQGEKVQKILVDGEEFFSDDPAVVNRSLQAKAIDKVQVFDKKSANAEFTGVDDGERTKTINLQLKDKYKKGSFGKVALGGGSNGFFENQAMFNLFRGKQKFSVYGIAANTAKIGLSQNDASKYTSSGSSMQMSDDGDMFFIDNNNDDGTSWDGQYNGEGLPKAWEAGAHYSNKWNNDIQHVNTNYRFNRRNIETLDNTFTQYNLQDSSYYTDQHSTSFSSIDKHTLSGLYEWKTDSASMLKFTMNGRKSNTVNRTGSETRSKGVSGALLNTSDRTSDNDGTRDNVDVNLSWQKRFKKKSRSMFLQLTYNNSGTNNEGYLHAANTFYSDGIQDSTTTIDQRKKNESNTNTYGAIASYTEPISQKAVVEVKYNFSSQGNYSRQLSFNKGAAGDYQQLDSLYSTDYNFDVTTHRLGTTFRWNYEKLSFSFGAAASNTEFRQFDNLYNREMNRTFHNFFPSANLNYKLSRQSSLRFRYSGYTQQPTVTQIQPVRQNTDPLNISVGNPNLKQEFDNSISLGYNSYRVLSGTYIYMGGGMSLVDNDISRSETIAASGVRTYQYVNVDGNRSSYLYAGIGTKIKGTQIQIGANTNVNVSRYNTIVNGAANKSDNNSYTVGLRAAYEKEKLIDFSFNPSVTYNYNLSSINAQNTSFWSAAPEASVLLYLPKKFQISSDASYNIRQRTATFDRNNNVFLLNASVSKKLLKGDQLEARFAVYDIFNQNLGFNRYGNGNTVVQQSYNTIKRYALLSLVWNFTYTPKGNAADGAASQIEEIQMSGK
ncbi:outer membrane beta-barrel family protein [Rurimicrobium arvi]|uniref:TonB-dependent receptor n=1 Tax=Rurimicrobium arvi TaxID=2049916 RepID=A0ABP8MWI4_9BACT